jgi:hypothetical protein
MTMPHCHAVVWIDHQQAHIVKFNRSESSGQLVLHEGAPAHIHHKAGSVGSGHVYEDDSYLHSVADALRDAEEIMLTGPSQVKWQLKSFLSLREPGLAGRVAAVETLNHPSDPELLALARKYFVRHDRMLPH